ncbi:hypothetical protein NKH50_25220 [Mesorhizobium sp. M1027]
MVAHAEQLPIDAGEAFPLHFLAQALLDLAVRSRAKVEADQLGRPFTDSRRDVVSRDDKIFAAVVLAADDNMGMRMTSVEMIDSDPVELGAEVFFHVRHEAPRERLEVVILDAVFRCDDEAELMPVPIGTIDEGLAINAVAVGAIELARLAFAGDAVALEVAKVCTCPVNTLAGQLDDTRLDDGAPLPKRRVGVARSENGGSSPAAPRPASDEAATATAAAAGSVDRGADLAGETLACLRAARSDFAQARLELFILH